MTTIDPIPQTAKVPVALQLWSVREEMNRDFAATVAAVGKMGYHGVELAGYGNLDAKGAKAALDGAGLRVAGMHVAFASLKNDMNSVINDALTVGAQNIVCPFWPPALFTSAAVCERLGEQLNELGAALRPYGLRFGFHNHASEFRIFDGRPAMDWILGASEPRNLFAEIDVYWAQFSGYSPAEFISEQGARVRLLHLKDQKELGSGPVDFEEVFMASDSVGSVEWFIVEQEEYSHAPLQSVRLCLDQLRTWGRA